MRRVSYWAALWGALLMAGAAHADRWEQRKGDCEQVFRGWRTQSIDTLRDCTMKWEQFRQVSEVDADMKSIVHEAFDRLYREGDKRDAAMALSALKRLGLRPNSLRPETGAVPTVAPPPPERVVRPTPPPRKRGVTFEPEAAPAPVADDAPPAMADPRRARSAYSAGKALVAQDPAAALSEFLIAADADPTYAPPLYMAARCYVALGKADLAIDALARMKAIDSQTARSLARHAATDPSFARLRAAGAFKDVTGSASIQILNGAGDEGLDVVSSYKSTLESNGLPVANLANDRNPRENTYVYTKPGFERQGESVRRLLKLGLVHERPIDWPSPYDLIIVYGKPEKTAWVDDEAEKAGKAAAEKKKKEAAAKKKKEEEAAAKKAEMRRKMQMLKMLEQMEAEDAAQQADPTGGDPVEAIPPP